MCCAVLQAERSKRPNAWFTRSSFILKMLGKHQKIDQVLQSEPLPSGGQKQAVQSAHSSTACSPTVLQQLGFFFIILIKLLKLMLF